MAGKSVTQEKKAVAKKATAPAKKTAAKAATKATTKNKLNKGDALVCGTCGLSVVVDEFGNVYGQELICCGEPLKQKPTKSNVKAKAKAKAATK